MTVSIVIMVIYMLIIIGLGFYVGRKVESSSDYAIGGRKIPGWAASLSERATGESAWALLGLPGAAYAIGFSELWTAIGCVTGIILAWIFISNKLRKESEKYSLNSYSEYFLNRFGKFGKIIQILSSLLISFFFFFYVGAQFIGGSKTLYQMYHLDITYGIIILFLMIVPYTIYGGYRSVVYTDVIQALIMIFTLIVGPIAGIFYISQSNHVFANSISEAISLAGEQYYSFTGFAGGITSGFFIISSLSWMFGYLGGMPQLAIRYMSIKNDKEAKKARIIGITWTLLAYCGALCLGWIGLAIFGPGTITDRELVMPAVVMTVFPPIIAAILLTGAFAAIISTANSLLILSSTEITETFKKNWLAKFHISELSLSRFMTTLFSIFALVFAIFAQEKLIYNIVKYVWAGIGSTYSVVIILSLYWKQYSGIAAFLTIISGILTTVIWLQTGLESSISCLFVTFLVSFIVSILSTFLSKNYKF